MLCTVFKNSFKVSFQEKISFLFNKVLFPLFKIDSAETFLQMQILLELNMLLLFHH